jgi:hypothetical protein
MNTNERTNERTHNHREGWKGRTIIEKGGKVIGVKSAKSGKNGWKNSAFALCIPLTRLRPFTRTRLLPLVNGCLILTRSQASAGPKVQISNLSPSPPLPLSSSLSIVWRVYPGARVFWRGSPTTQQVVAKAVVRDYTDPSHPTSVAMSVEAILSGWSDGQIRCHGTEDGRHLFNIADAHRGGVNALTLSGNEVRGGGGGMRGGEGRGGAGAPGGGNERAMCWSIDRKEVHAASVRVACVDHNRC